MKVCLVISPEHVIDDLVARAWVGAGTPVATTYREDRGKPNSNTPAPLRATDKWRTHFPSSPQTVLWIEQPASHLQQDVDDSRPPCLVLRGARRTRHPD